MIKLTPFNDSGGSSVVGDVRKLQNPNVLTLLKWFQSTFIFCMLYNFVLFNSVFLTTIGFCYQKNVMSTSFILCSAICLFVFQFYIKISGHF